MKDYWAHETAVVDDGATIGSGTKVWHFAHIFASARIGERCSFGQNTMVAANVTVGNNVKVQNNVAIYEGTTIEDDVFLGPSCVLTNVSNPRSQVVRRGIYEPTRICRGATVGANATIVCGVTLGQYCFVAAGAVVTRDVQPYGMVVGVPARQSGWISRHGHPLKLDEKNQAACPESGLRYKLSVDESVEKIICLDLDDDAVLPPGLSRGTKAYREIRNISVTDGSTREVSPIPFIDLQAQQERIKPQIDSAIQRVLAHGKYIMGPEVFELEERLAEFVGAKHCITVSNGTDALSVSLMALEVGPGDAVITTPFTFFATVEAIMLRGATPIFADIDPQTYNICPQEIRRAITRVVKTTDLNLRGIITVDLYGLPCDYASIRKITDEYDLFLLQDAAQSFGATYGGKRAPSHGDIGTTSFFPAKPLGCYGDGGAVFTDDDTVASAARSIRVHGKGIDKYDNVRVGLNARLDTIQAAILLEKLKIYPEELQLRQQVANRYAAAISNLQAEYGTDCIRFQQVPNDTQSAWAQFVIQSPAREQIAIHLRQQGVPTVVYYRTPAHLLRACKDLPGSTSHKLTESVAKQILAIPIHPYRDERARVICDEIHTLLAD